LILGAKARASPWSAAGFRGSSPAMLGEWQKQVTVDEYIALSQPTTVAVVSKIN
jgi:hypothetical protein